MISRALLTVSNKHLNIIIDTIKYMIFTIKYRLPKTIRIKKNQQCWVAITYNLNLKSYRHLSILGLIICLIMKNLALHFRIIILYLNGKSATPTIHCTADVRYYECPYQLAPYDKTNLAEHSTITNIRINITLVSKHTKQKQTI